jgi:penicillin amidase
MRSSRVWAVVSFVVAAIALVLMGCAGEDYLNANDKVEEDGDTADGDIPDGDADGDAAEGDQTDLAAVLSAEIDQSIPIPGLTDAVAVATDSFGVPHIYAKNELDAMRVMGWVQASNRYVEMEFLRSLSRGKLTELIGAIPATIGADVFYRAIFSTKDGGDLFEKMVEMMDPDVKASMMAFLEGVNARLAKYREDPSDWPEPLQFPLLDFQPIHAADWTPADVLAIGRYQAWSLAGSLGFETEMTQLLAVLGQDLYNEMISPEPNLKLSILDHVESFKAGHRGQAVQLPPADYQRMMKPLLERIEQIRALNVLKTPGASNNWVVERDDTGTAYLCNDPHLSLQQPSVFMPMSIDLTLLTGNPDALHVGGVTFPGTPVFIIGRTDTVGWALTTTNLDVMDLYLEHVTFNDAGEPVSVAFKGEQVGVSKVIHKLRQGHGGLDSFVEVPIYFVPHHGPLLEDTFDKENGTAISLRWTGLEVTREVQAVYKLSRGTDVDSLFKTLLEFEVGAQNFVLADTKGNIGYFPHGLVPIRSGNLREHPPWLVMPGDGSAEWVGYIPEDVYPKLKNPTSGMIVTANNDITGTTLDGDPLNESLYTMGFTTDGYRAHSIKKGLLDMKEAGGWTWEDMRDLQFNYRSDFAELTLTALLDLSDKYDVPDMLNDEAKGALEMLQAWNYEVLSGLSSTDPEGALSGDADVLAKSAAATYFYHLFVRLGHELLSDELQAAGLSGNSLPSDQDSRAVVRILLNASNENDISLLWDNVSTEDTVEGPGEILVAAIEAAVIDVLAHTEYSGISLDQAAWGRVHTLTMSHPLSLMTDWFNEGPFALGGGPNTVNVASFGPALNPENQRYGFGSGPSVRFIHEVREDGMLTRYNLPGGVNERSDSEHYLDLFNLWTQGEMTELYIAWESVKNAGTESITAYVPAP